MIPVADLWYYSGTRTRAEHQYGEWVRLGWEDDLTSIQPKVIFLWLALSLMRPKLSHYANDCSQTLFTFNLNDLMYNAFDFTVLMLIVEQCWFPFVLLFVFIKQPYWAIRTRRLESESIQLMFINILRYCLFAFMWSHGYNVM